MPHPKTRRFWEIKGWDSTKEIYSRRVPYGSISEQRLSSLLAALAARHGLTDDETVDSYLNPMSKQTQPYALSCGRNPYFGARIVDG